MKLIFGTDHRGFFLKEAIKQAVMKASKNAEIVDVGAQDDNPTDDFVDYAQKAIAAMDPKEDRCILLCGSGHGMDMAANRYKNIRAIIGFNNDVVVQGRQHEDANVLVIPADWTTPEEAITRLQLFLATPYSRQEKYQRRLDKLCQLPPQS
jgi:ribose 5-phosphate isomerase B